MTMLKFARDLAAFESHLEWAAHADDPYGALTRSPPAICTC